MPSGFVVPLWDERDALLAGEEAWEGERARSAEQRVFPDVNKLGQKPLTACRKYAILPELKQTSEKG